MVAHDLAGQRFGRLVAMERVPRPGHLRNTRSYWRCRCDCGQSIVSPSNSLLQGHSKSCGCLKRELTRARSTTHGKSGSGELSVWKAMLTRCHNPNSACRDAYAGRGIYVCDRWRNSFPAFLSDMGERPTPAHTLERIDNDGPYSPDNCRWATRAEQSRNTRKTIRLTHDGKTLCLQDWSELTGVRYITLYRRFRCGWTADRVLAPVGQNTGVGF